MVKIQAYPDADSEGMNWMTDEGIINTCYELLGRVKQINSYVEEGIRLLKETYFPPGKYYREKK